MGVEVARSRDSARVTITGPADVRTVAKVRELLMEALEKSRPAVVDLSGASSVDAAFFQLTVAAERSFDSQGVPLSIEGAEMPAAALPGAKADGAAKKGEQDAG